MKTKSKECDLEAGNQPNEHESHNHPQPERQPQSEGSGTDSSDRYCVMFFGAFKLILLERSMASDPHHYSYAEVLHNLLWD